MVQNTGHHLSSQPHHAGKLTHFTANVNLVHCHRNCKTGQKISNLWTGRLHHPPGFLLNLHRVGVWALL
jgi:hypothetical protein